MDQMSRGLVTRIGFAAFLTVAATWVRLGLQTALGDHLPFSIYFLSVLLTAWVAGTLPAVVALALGVLAAEFWVLPPDSVMFMDLHEQISLVIYLAVGGVSIAMFHRLGHKQEEMNRQLQTNADLMAQLQEADRRKDNWLALLAHELRNPLAPIRSGLDLLDREPKDFDQCRQVRTAMRRQIDQLVRIVEDLLDVSRYVRGQLRLERRPIDLRDVVEQAIETVAPAVAERSHTLKYVRSRRPLPVSGDPVRLVQAISNVLSNSVRYTPNGGRIQVLFDQDQSSVILGIVDNGIGIDKESQQRVFGLFAQADSSATRDRQGLGIGLALVKSLIEMHDGQVSLTSNGPGAGCCFQIVLPLLPETVMVTEPVAQSAKLPPEGVPKQEHREGRGQPVVGRDMPAKCDDEVRAVLIIDDNHEAVATLEALLKLDGFQTFAAYDGPSGIEAMAVVQPDYVLLDIGMPGMDGYEVARRIRRQHSHPSLRIIAVSGWGAAEDRERSRSAGFDDHLVKPVDYRELVAALRRTACIVV
jgi:two-component system CheB/CheR fusion protein